MICHEMIRSKSCFILQITRGKTLSYFAFASKADSDNLTDFAKSGSWSMYDQELINNGPKYKYKMPVRLVGALGRLLDPPSPLERKHEGPEHIQGSPVSASELEMRDPFPVS